jgi:hypothetical protein
VGGAEEDIWYIEGQDNRGGSGDIVMKISMNRAIKSRNIRWAGHVAGKGERTYRALVGGGEAEGKKLLGRRRYT